MGDIGAQHVSGALTSCRNMVSHLILDGNGIGSEGAMAIARALQSANCRVSKLYLKGNGIGREGVLAVMAAGRKMKRPPSLSV